MRSDVLAVLQVRAGNIWGHNWFKIDGAPDLGDLLLLFDKAVAPPKNESRKRQQTPPSSNIQGGDRNAVFRGSVRAS